MELPLSSLIIIVLLLILLVFAGLWKSFNRKRLLKVPPKTNASRTAEASVSNPNPQVPRTSTATTPDQITSAEVDETSILEEIEIYLAYGHLEQAATSLSWYVAHHPDDIQQSRKLLALYQEIPDMDRFADWLSHLYDTGIISGVEAQDLVLTGLHSDPENLQLRVLAENTGISNSQLAAISTMQDTGNPAPTSPALLRAQQELQQALVNPEPLDMDISGFSEKSQPDLKNKAHSAPVSGEEALLQGQSHLETISPREWSISATLVDPLTTVRVLQATQQNAEAEHILKRNLIFDPRKLVLHVALLDIFYRQKRCENFAEALLQLYISLWGAGAALRARMLNHGRQLGDHPLWGHLEASETNKHILAEQAEQYGLYLPLTAIPFTSPALVLEEIRRDHRIVIKDNDDSILQEFDSLLEYGQVEEAVDLLEKATLARPDHKIYYRPLLEMYERMGAHERFSRFARAILNMETPPDAAIMRQMFSLAERMQRQPVRQVI
ncbi:FimV family protein [Acidithiobacillus sp. M4-SHS-6]|uniref:type IV pilus assembly protein FimV n=1 Tax=Acidithiobacillus sp. M4-SHS-6 TaxID=3383024 RepID=UPI0039BE97C2